MQSRSRQTHRDYKISIFCFIVNYTRYVQFRMLVLVHHLLNKNIACSCHDITGEKTCSLVVKHQFQYFAIIPHYVSNHTLLPARLLCKFIRALESLILFSFASMNILENWLAHRTLSLHPPHSYHPRLSRPRPDFDGSQPHCIRSPLLHALVTAWTTPADEIA